MPRVKRGNARARHKKVNWLIIAAVAERSSRSQSGNEGRSICLSRPSQQKRVPRTVDHRINAACREQGISYSAPSPAPKASIELDRKVLADMYVNDKAGFAAVVAQAKSALAA